MAKNLALTVPLLMALIALAGATTYTTTVTVDEESNWYSQGCQKQLQGKPFRSCQRYLRSRSPYADGEEDNDDDIVLEMSTNPSGRQPDLQNCCQQLRRVNQPCQCAAIRHALRQMQGQQEDGHSAQAAEKARSLPRRCNLQAQHCQIHSVFV